MCFDLVVIFLQESAVWFFDDMELAEDVERMFKRDRSVQCLHHIYYSSLSSSHPISEIHIVWHSCTEHDESDMFG